MPEPIHPLIITYFHLPHPISLFYYSFLNFAGIPDEIRGFWSQYPFPFDIWFCRFRSMASEAFLYISIMTILAFTIERHLAIVYPLLSRMFMTSRKSRIWKIVFFIWIFAILNAVPYGVFSEINYLPYPGDPKRLIKESAWCGVAWEHIIIRRFLEYSFVAFFMLPFVALAALYIQIGITLSQQAVLKTQIARTPPLHSPSDRTPLPAGDPHPAPPPNNNVETRKNYRHLRSRISVIKMLVGIVASFFICFSVFHAQRLMTMYVDWTTASDFLKNLYTDLHKVSGTLYYLNPTLNPIMYALHTKKFRYLLRKWLLPCGWTASDSRRPSTFSYSQTSNISLRRRTLTTTQGASSDELETMVPTANNGGTGHQSDNEQLTPF
ncbi:neuropeptides capa receptor-like isoform X2 [Paramacrobiotus metropolitanus]|uniref:neuropeptides capa receptor-like isoform X2 n=1 Tax=Paramacrobiotus metropolitanus TaxID=2943436 RepID=UPI0024459318|nr:neuropeptides capa receptor-like isoform X2 [Paramacrobiotus metropolitanus]